MHTTIECAKLTIQVPKDRYQLAVSALVELGILHYYTNSSRIVALYEKEAFLFFPAKIELFENNAEIIKLYVPKAFQRPAIAALAKILSLHVHGNGSIYAESIKIIYDPSGADVINEHTIDQNIQSQTDDLVLNNLWAISCIVQRGEADRVVKAALDLGVGIPSVVFGMGTGFRNKLGLLRVVIPAEKEVVNLVVHKNNVAEVMDTLITAGELEMPGKGFIYNYPLGPGIISSKMFYGKQRHLATMEQVISAIDSLKGGQSWRIKESFAPAKKRKMLTELVGLNIYCNEGLVFDLIDRAMEVGSVGATVSLGRLKQNESAAVQLSSSQEIAAMVMGQNKMAPIIEAVAKGGLFESYGMIELKSVQEACTYLGE